MQRRQLLEKQRATAQSAPDDSLTPTPAPTPAAPPAPTPDPNDSGYVSTYPMLDPNVPEAGARFPDNGEL